LHKPLEGKFSAKFKNWAKKNPGIFCLGSALFQRIVRVIDLLLLGKAEFKG
jgi:hypothetical protein